MTEKSEQHSTAEEARKMTDAQVESEYGHLIANAKRLGSKDPHQTLVDNGGYASAIVAEKKRRGL